jgi:hypothetical protein
MSSPDLEAAFPGLQTGEYIVTSPRSRRYNCIAWAAGANSGWWWPDEDGLAFWPSEPREVSLAAFVRAFETMGYQPCESDAPEPGFEKVAIYVGLHGRPTHMARQLATGEWTSKCGRAEDITHSLSDLEGEAYGRVSQVLKRPVGTARL